MRIQILIGGEERLGADLENPDAPLSEIVLELGRSLQRIEAGEGRELKFNDSQRIITTCQADRDGDCIHKQCPQISDNEPHKTGRHCPLDNP